MWRIKLVNLRTRFPDRNSAVVYFMQALLVLIPSSAALGPLVPIWGPIYLYRLLVMLWIVAALSYWFHYKSGNSKYVSYIVVFLVLWGTSTIIGVCIANDRPTAFNTAVNVALGLFFVGSTILVSTLVNVTKALIVGFLCSFLVTTFFALRELITGSRLSNFVTGDEHSVAAYGLVASTFGNPNNYSTYIAVVLPIFIVYCFVTDRVWKRLLSGFCILASIFLVLATGSRLGIFVLAIQVLVAAILYRRRLLIPAAIFGTAVAVFTVAYQLGFGTGTLPFLSSIGSNLQSIGSFISGGEDGSGSVRVNLTLNGLYVIASNWGFGIGPGNLPSAFSSGDLPYHIGVFSNPHNGYVEIAAEFGLLILVGIFVGLVLAFRIVWLNECNLAQDDRHFLALFLTSVCGMAIGVLLPSSIVTWPVMWVWFAFVMTIPNAVTVFGYFDQQRVFVRKPAIQGVESG